MKTKMILVVVIAMLALAVAPVPVAASPKIETAYELQVPQLVTVAIEQKPLCGINPACTADQVCEYTCPSGYLQCVELVENQLRICSYAPAGLGICGLQCKTYGSGGDN